MKYNGVKRFCAMLGHGYYAKETGYSLATGSVTDNTESDSLTSLRVGH
jgi:hypothetical protein